MTIDQLLELMPHAAEDIKLFRDKMPNLFCHLDQDFAEDDLVFAFLMGYNAGAIAESKELIEKYKNFKDSK